MRPERGREHGQNTETSLTLRQSEVLDRVIRGLENKQIARELGVSEQAVKAHVSILLDRFSVPNRAALAEAGTALAITGHARVEPTWLQYLFSEAPVMIAMLRGPDHVIEIANAAYRRACSGRECVGRRLREVFPEISPEMLAIYDDVFASGRPQTRHEMPARFLSEGRPEPGFGSFVFQPLRGESGAVDGVMVFCIDVTEQVRARERLAELATEHLAVLDQVPSGVLVFAADGRLVNINEAARMLVGGALVGSTPEERRASGWLLDARTGLPLEIGDYASTRALRGETVSVDYRYRREGIDVVLHTRATPLRRADGSIRGAVLVMTEA